MTFVLDASFAAAWLLPDEGSAIIEEVIRQTMGRAVVPSLFWHEVRNILLIAERRDRIGVGEATKAMSRLRRLTLETLDSTDDAAVLGLATAHRLSAYDAAYLETAIFTKRALATLDRALATAAKASVIEVLGPCA